jgi:cytochrome c peroxidase
MRWLLSFSALLPLAVALGACQSPSGTEASPAPSASLSTSPASFASPASPAQQKRAVVTKGDIDPVDFKVFLVLPARWDSDDNPITEAKVKLGRALFYEPRLSKNHDISCSSCHDLETYGIDHHPVSTGHKGQTGRRNALSVYNTGGHIALFWDGRAETLEEQAKGPILNPVEMAMPNAASVVAALKSIPGYVTMFQEAFPGAHDPLTFDNVAKAIAAFERQLVTPGRFDSYLKGDEKALTEEELTGLYTFIKLGCPTCHNRAQVGAKNIQRLGLVKDYPGLTDNGRSDVTKDERDRYYFRVASLRNVEKTGPYFHDGSVATLDQAVRNMAMYQLGVELMEEEVNVLVAFLKSLTGEIPRDYIQKPDLPPSGPMTPKPDPR